MVSFSLPRQKRVQGPQITSIPGFIPIGRLSARNAAEGRRAHTRQVGTRSPKAIVPARQELSGVDGLGSG